MNLIKLQDQLRSMPMQALQQYANGMNPEVPPWLALSVLQQKQMDAQRQKVAQGAAMGEMPTVKEKVEQSAGLMALQGQKQQQAAQQSAMQNMRKPGPVPGGVPPAEPQPQAPQMGMRAGGIVRLPSGLRMAGGGIVGYKYGGSPSAMWAEIQRLKSDPDALRRQPSLQAKLAKLEAAYKEAAKQAAPKPPPMNPALVEQLAKMQQQNAPSDIASDVGREDEQPSGIQNLLARRARSATRMRDVQGQPQGAYQTTPEDLKGSVPGFDAGPAGADQTVAAPAVSAAPNIPDVQMPQAAAPAAAKAPEAPSQPSMPRYDTPQAAFEAQQKLNEMAGYKAPEYSETRSLDEEIRARKQADRKRQALTDLFTTLSGASQGYGGMTATADALSRRRAAEQTAEDTRRAGLASMYDTGKQEFAKSNVVGAGGILGKGISESGAMGRTMLGEQGATQRTAMTEGGANARALMSQQGQNARTAAQIQGNMTVAQMNNLARAAIADLDRNFNAKKLKATTEVTLQQLAATQESNRISAQTANRKERELALNTTKALISFLQDQLQSPAVMADKQLMQRTQESLAAAQQALRESLGLKSDNTIDFNDIVGG